MKHSRAKTASRVTIGDIADEVGLSGAAVSMALRGSKRVSESTRKRVAEAAKQLGYIYDRGAAKLRTGHSQTIGVVVGDISNPFFGELVIGVDQALAGTGMISFLLNSREDPALQQELLNRLREQGVDGIIVCPAVGTDPTLFDRFAAGGIPVVQMLRGTPGSSGDFVSTDYRTGMESLCEHLIRKGHHRFAFVGGDLDHSATRQRLAGYRAALGRNGLDSSQVFRVPPTRTAGKQTAARLPEGDARPTAVVCFSDHVAFGMMAGLRDLGLVTGRDIAVTGFDNIEEAADSWPPLTTVEVRAKEIGIEAGRLLLRRLEDPAMTPEQVILPTRIVIRQSCGTTSIEGSHAQARPEAVASLESDSP